MVSSRPPPNPVKGRIAYPSATTYVPGDSDVSPAYLGASDSVSKSPTRQTDLDSAQGLKTWWKGFNPKPDVKDERGVFGVSLSDSIRYASVQISTAGPDGALYVWGIIPVVVAKCGLYLKESATEVEGTFRISGSAKRMRDLQAVFDTGPKFGKNVDWKTLSYNTHDVATIFRRFLTQMPEPVIPYDLYEAFRLVLSQELPLEESISQYKNLIVALPPINQYLLLYVLDLLSVFDRKSDVNLMTAPNLALIFQPGILSHPSHSMRPREHVLSQQVLEFLIAQQDNFLIGMELTSSTEQESSPSPAPPRSPSPPPAPAYVKADEETMLPSDSDDEAPAGGYYIIEGPQRAISPPMSPPPLSSINASLWPHKPTRYNPPIGSLKAKGPAQNRPRTVHPPVIEHMEASDSDDDAPPGGYEVRTTDPTELQERLARTKIQSPRTASNGSITRRRTLPTKRVEKSEGRRRSGTIEAP